MIGGFHPQAAVFVLIAAGGAVQLQGGQVAAQALLPLGVGGQVGLQRSGCPGENAAQFGILTAHRLAAFPQAALVLAAAEEYRQLLIGGCQKIGKVQAAGGEMGRKVGGQGAAPVHHGGGGVVEGVEGCYIIPLPAIVPEGAAAAHTVGGPVEHQRHVGRVFRRGVKGAPEALVQLAEGGRGFIHARAHIFGGLLGGFSLGFPQQRRVDPAQHPLGEQHEANRSHEDLVQAGNTRAAFPGPENAGGVGQHEGQGGGQPAFLFKRAGHQPGKAIGHAVIRSGAACQIHGKPRADTGGRAVSKPAPEGHQHHQQSGRQTAQRNITQQVNLGKGHEHRDAQHQHAHRPPQIGLGLVLRPGGEGGAVEIHRRAGKNQLGEEKNYIRGKPATVG
ncbi:hypothetical protein SDC9_93327 [bioreactor metagenome]|uniref:Uncharacterized protein n=1 Tax=bioreactor metagenome TaxID=1076179 RepID=A0A645A0Q7_9ZZZZ